QGPPPVAGPAAGFVHAPVGRRIRRPDRASNAPPPVTDRRNPVSGGEPQRRADARDWNRLAPGSRRRAEKSGRHSSPVQRAVAEGGREPPGVGAGRRLSGGPPLAVPPVRVGGPRRSPRRAAPARRIP